MNQGPDLRAVESSGARPRQGAARALQGRRRLVLAAAVLLASCAASVDRRVEQMVLDALPRYLGPADDYAVSVRGASLGGERIDELRATGRRVHREGSPVLDRVEVLLTDVVIDRAARRISNAGGAEATLQLTAADLTRYLRAQDWIEDPAVRFEAPSAVVVSGRLRVPGMALPATPVGEFRGQLVPRDSRLLMRVEALSVGGRQAPGLVRAILEQAVNPVFDTAQYAVPSRIDEATVQGDRMVLRASGSRTVPPR